MYINRIFMFLIQVFLIKMNCALMTAWVASFQPDRHSHRHIIKQNINNNVNCVFKSVGLHKTKDLLVWVRGQEHMVSQTDSARWVCGARGGGEGGATYFNQVRRGQGRLQVRVLE